MNFYRSDLFYPMILIDKIHIYEKVLKSLISISWFKIILLMKRENVHENGDWNLSKYHLIIGSCK